MNRLRNRLIAVFLAATLAPLGVTLWMTTFLLERSLSYASTRELDEISKSLEKTGREFYQRAREQLKKDAVAGRLPPQRYPESDRKNWAEPLQEFWESGESERFLLTGSEGNRLDYLWRRGHELWIFSSGLEVGMEQLSKQYRRARELVENSKVRDLRRGFTYTYVLLAASIGLFSLIVLIFLAHRISRPIQQLTAGLSELASGNLSARIESRQNDEVGRAIQAFNHMAGQLQQSRERLVYLTQIASWQTLARKMAHEVKNSLTPIRLTVEEMLARHHESNRAFLEQAAQIVADEVETLERRISAFSQFSAEPAVRLVGIDVNLLLEERISFLKAGHPEVAYSVRMAENRPSALADEDLLKGILMNLLENAAEAAGSGGTVLGVTFAFDRSVAIEIHDSGPGLSEQVRKSLFQPTISFKKKGMGLGLSIARRSALLSGGDIFLVKGELGGAAFRVVLPIVTNGIEAHPDRG